MNFSREFDLSSLLSPYEQGCEFVVDPIDQVIFVRPQPTGLFGYWTRLVAWWCRAKPERESERILNGTLPLKFNGAAGIEPKYLVDGLRNSLCDFPGFDSAQFEEEAGTLSLDLGTPGTSPVALARRLVDRCLAGASKCSVENMAATRRLVAKWLDGPQARELGFASHDKQKLIRFAVFSLKESRKLNGLDQAPEQLAQLALQAAIGLVIKSRNECSLRDRINALPGDASSPHFKQMKSRVAELTKQTLLTGSPVATWTGDRLDKAIADAYLQARAELLAAQLGIELQWAREVAKASLDLKAVGSVTLPFIHAFPSAKEVNALLTPQLPAVKAAADLLLLCGTATQGQSSGQIFTALWEMREAINQLLAKLAPGGQALPAERQHALVQNVMAVAVTGLVREHRGKPELAKIVKAFESDKPRNRTRSIWRALRSSDVAAKSKPAAQELDRFFSMLIVEFTSELLKAEHQHTTRVEGGRSTTELAKDMHAAIERALNAEGTNLTLIRSDLRNALREKL